MRFGISATISRDIPLPDTALRFFNVKKRENNNNRQHTKAVVL